MTQSKQARVRVEWMDGVKRDFRYASGVNVNYQLGVVEIYQPKEHPKGQVVLPYMAPNSVRVLVIEQEELVELKAQLVVPQ